MSRDWNRIASGIAPEIPKPELERVVNVLQALETQFAPLRENLAHDTEPAVILPSLPSPEELA
jgi:hypothetical protein